MKLVEDLSNTRVAEICAELGKLAEDQIANKWAIAKRIRELVDEWDKTAKNRYGWIVYAMKHCPSLRNKSLSWWRFQLHGQEVFDAVGDAHPGALLNGISKISPRSAAEFYPLRDSDCAHHWLSCVAEVQNLRGKEAIPSRNDIKGYVAQFLDERKKPERPKTAHDFADEFEKTFPIPSRFNRKQFDEKLNEMKPFLKEIDAVYLRSWVLAVDHWRNQWSEVFDELEQEFNQIAGDIGQILPFAPPSSDAAPLDGDYIPAAPERHPDLPTPEEVKRALKNMGLSDADLKYREPAIHLAGCLKRMRFLDSEYRCSGEEIVKRMHEQDEKGRQVIIDNLRWAIELLTEVEETLAGQKDDDQ